MNEAPKKAQVLENHVANNTTNDVHDLKKLLVQPVGSANPRTQDTKTSDDAETPAYYGVVIGSVVNVTHNDGFKNIFVSFPGNPNSTPIIAKTVLEINSGHEHSEVTLMFDGGNLISPIITGIIQNREIATEKPTVNNTLDLGDLTDENINAELDVKTLTFKAKDQIKLECGKASITLTKSGKILLRGEYVMSRSTGVNSIKGGSVQLN